MADDKHTPGPWFQSHRQKNDGMYSTEVYDAKGETIATVAWFPIKTDVGGLTTNRDINARLIAAAPDLLVALKNFVNGAETGAITSEQDEVFANAIAQANNAISKAQAA